MRFDSVVLAVSELGSASDEPADDDLDTSTSSLSSAADSNGVTSKNGLPLLLHQRLLDSEISESSRDEGKERTMIGDIVLTDWLDDPTAAATGAATGAGPAEASTSLQGVASGRVQGQVEVMTSNVRDDNSSAPFRFQQLIQVWAK